MVVPELSLNSVGADMIDFMIGKSKIYELRVDEKCISMQYSFGAGGGETSAWRAI